MARKLGTEEKNLWDRVASTAIPMHRKLKPKVDPLIAPKKAAKPKSTAEPDWIVPAFTISSQSKKTATAAAPAKIPPKMDAKAFSKMQRGKLRPEGRIDLHGMTQDVAYSALVNFITRAHRNSLRLVLVITGKGRVKEDFGPIPERIGVLRQNVPRWLATPALRSIVLQVSPAHKSHGGDGAYYVYLRRN